MKFFLIVSCFFSINSFAEDVNVNNIATEQFESFLDAAELGFSCINNAEEATGVIWGMDPDKKFPPYIFNEMEGEVTKIGSSSEGKIVSPFSDKKLESVFPKNSVKYTFLKDDKKTLQIEFVPEKDSKTKGYVFKFTDNAKDTYLLESFTEGSSESIKYTCENLGDLLLF